MQEEQDSLPFVVLQDEHESLHFQGRVEELQFVQEEQENLPFVVCAGRAGGLTFFSFTGIAGTFFPFLGIAGKFICCCLSSKSCRVYILQSCSIVYLFLFVQEDQQSFMLYLVQFDQLSLHFVVCTGKVAELTCCSLYRKSSRAYLLQFVQEEQQSLLVVVCTGRGLMTGPGSFPVSVSAWLPLSCFLLPMFQRNL